MPRTTHRMTQFDVVVVGAGPAGIISAMLLANSGLKTVIVEKNLFPRVKTCGDGLTPDIFNQLHLCDPVLARQVVSSTHFFPHHQLILKAPNGKEVEVPIPSDGQYPGMSAMRRADFDLILLEHLKNLRHVEIFTGCRVGSLRRKGQVVELTTSLGPLTSRMIVGADGANSIAAGLVRRPAISPVDKAFAVRGYFRFSQSADLLQGSPRVIFDRRLLPGYLWMFPLADGVANIGLGMDAAYMLHHQLNLKKMLWDLLPEFFPVSVYGTPAAESSLRGHYIPLGRNRRPVSGERVLLAGDAAALAYPLTGEGIGNALRSGRLAAQHVIRCFSHNRFDSGFNLQYDRELYRLTAGEFRNFRLMQHLFRYPAVLNLLARVATPRLIASLTLPGKVTGLQSGNHLLLKLLWKVAFER